MSKLLLFNKPFDVLTQFTDSDNRATLADFIKIKGVYPAGRLDRDSEGLLPLTDDGQLQQRISNPRHKLEKTYWAQVEGNISDEALTSLRTGLMLKDGQTKPALARRIDAPELWERVPPIRVRLNIPTTWVELTITEGKNRQVRRMTAASGFPTLRLIRVRIGEWELGKMQPGEFRLLEI
jgi:23S rRNA pseudouridine2457 synthase